MKIGDFRWQTTNRDLAACLGTLGVPLKKDVPIVNNYSERKPIPSVPFGHPRWYAGKLRWFFEAISDTLSEPGRPVTPKDITTAFHNRIEADKLDASLDAISAAFKAKDFQSASELFDIHKRTLPFAMAGIIGKAMENRQRIFLPLLKKAYEQEKITGLGPDLVTVSEGESETHMTKNPSEEVKDALT